MGLLYFYSESFSETIHEKNQKKRPTHHTAITTTGHIPIQSTSSQLPGRRLY